MAPKKYQLENLKGKRNSKKSLLPEVYVEAIHFGWSFLKMFKFVAFCLIFLVGFFFLHYEIIVMGLSSIGRNNDHLKHFREKLACLY